MKNGVTIPSVIKSKLAALMVVLKGVTPIKVTAGLLISSIILVMAVSSVLYTVLVLQKEDLGNLVDCEDDVNLNYNDACLDGNSIRVDIDNEGVRETSNFMSFLIRDNNIFNKNFGYGVKPDSSSNIYFVYNSSIDYDYVHIYPVFNISGEVISCPGEKLDLDNLKVCPISMFGSCGDGVLSVNKYNITEVCDPGLDEDFDMTEDVFSCEESSLGDRLTGCSDNCSMCLYRGNDGGNNGGDSTPESPISFTFGINSAVKSNFWYPLVIQVDNTDTKDISGFLVVMNGTSGNDEYQHRHTIFSGDATDFNVFYSARVGTIDTITLVPGIKNFLSNGSVSWTWYGNSNVSTTTVVDNSNWDNVLGYWNFKDGGGYSAYDGSPYDTSCNVHLDQTPVWKSDKYCLFGRCYYMDGAHEGLNCSNLAHFDDEVTTEITVEAVIRPWRVLTDNESKNRLIASKYFADLNGSRSWVFRLDNDTQHMLFRIYRPSATGDSWRTVEPTVARPLTVGAVWHHMAAWYNGTMARLYLDGEKIGERDWGSTVYPINPSHGVDVMIGDWFFWSGDTFNGRIESVTIYNKSLDESLIQKHARDLFSLADCPRTKKTREPNYCQHIGSYGIDNSVDISQPSGGYSVDGGVYHGLREYANFSNPGNCDVAIMAVHGGSTEIGTEQMARYMYEQLSAAGEDVALWVYGSRNTECSNCDVGCEDYCHHVTSAAMEPECDPYLREVVSQCKTAVALHGCYNGCRPSENTTNLPPVLIGGRAEYDFKTLLFDELNTTLSDQYYFVNFDDVDDCKYYFDNVSCYRGADHCNIVNRLAKYNYLEGFPGIQIELPTELRMNTTKSHTDAECNVANPPTGCLTRHENSILTGETLITANGHIQAIRDYIALKGW
jgi:hypothetical protein